MWIIDIPSPFAPRSEILGFLRDCERDEDDPKVRAAMATVQRYLDRPDPREAASAKKKSR